MENDPLVWVTPLALLPGVGLLILSTSARFGQLHEELHHIEDHGQRSPQLVSLLMRRAVRFRNALFCLYSAVTGFALGSLLGGLAAALELSVGPILVLGLSFVSIVLVVIASVFLISETTLFLGVFRDHFKRLGETDL